MVHRRRERQTTPGFLLRELHEHEQCEKAKRYDTGRSAPGQKVSSMLLGKSGGQVLTAPERTKWLGHSGNNAQPCMCLVVKVKSDAIKEQYGRGTWNVRSMNQGKLDVAKQEMARGNIDILGISQLKWTGMGEFKSDYHCIYYCWQDSVRRNGVAIIVNKSLKCSTWMQSQK